MSLTLAVLLLLEGNWSGRVESYDLDELPNGVSKEPLARVSPSAPSGIE
jgi:hypothetical protein